MWVGDEKEREMDKEGCYKLAKTVYNEIFDKAILLKCFCIENPNLQMHDNFVRRHFLNLWYQGGNYEMLIRVLYSFLNKNINCG